MITLLRLCSGQRNGSEDHQEHEPISSFRFKSQSSLPKCELQTTLQWFHSFLLYFWVNPTRMGRRGRERAVHFLHFLRRTYLAFQKREGNFSPKGAVGMKEAGSYRFQNASLSFPFFFRARAYRYNYNKEKFMDEVIGVTNGYGCRNRRKSRTVGYLLNQSTSRVLRLQGGGALLRRQLRFLVASFWRLAS